MFQELDAIGLRLALLSRSPTTDKEMMTMQARFASTEGLHQEASGVTPLAALDMALSGVAR